MGFQIWVLSYIETYSSKKLMKLNTVRNPSHAPLSEEIHQHQSAVNYIYCSHYHHNSFSLMLFLLTIRLMLQLAVNYAKVNIVSQYFQR